MTVTLTNDELMIAAQALGCQSSDLKANAPARLYTSNGGSSWEYTGYCGIVSVTMDPKISALYLSFTDLSSKRCVLVQEAYKDFDYKELTPYMHAFEGDSTVFGLSFAESFDAKQFLITTKGIISLCNSVMPTKVVTKTAAPAAAEKTGFGSKIRGLFGGKKEEQRARPVISGAKNFKHVSHLGFSGKAGFGDIPPEWKSIFEKAGVTEEELKDKKTAKFIMKTIATAGDVPLPPPPRSGAPAPPVSSNTGSSSSAPPPPPPPGPMKSAPPPPSTSLSNGPPPPPRAAFHSASSSSDMGSGDAPASTDMLTMIRETKLKKVTESDIPKLDQMSETQQSSLANKIQQAMNARRAAVVDDSDDSDEDWEI